MQTLTKKLMITAAIIGLPASAWAAMAVIDTTAISKQIDQLTKMQEQTTIITDMRDKVQSQIDAFGEIGNIDISVPNVDSLGTNLTNNLECLKPDLPEMMPEVDFGDIDMEALDLCGKADVYEQTLYVDNERLNGFGSDYAKRSAYIREVEKQRDRLNHSSIKKGLALADTAHEEAEEAAKAADELQAKGKAAKDLRTQNAVLLQATIAQIREQSRTNQLLAALLKLQSSEAAMRSSLNGNETEGADK